MTKTYSLPLEVVELIASLANDYGSQRKVIETAVYALAGEPLPDAAPKRQIRAEPAEPDEPTPNPTQPPARKSWAEQQREKKVRDAAAAGVCPDCGDVAEFCSC